MHHSAKMDLEVKASGRNKTHGLVLSPDFWPTRRLYICVVSSLSQRKVVVMAGWGGQRQAEIP